MTNTIQELSTILIRPTLVIGLGGSGCKVAVHLKARLEEQFGRGSSYGDVIQFLCMDTADENYRVALPTPDDPERQIALTDSEFIRISEVPLNDLMRERGGDSGIGAILPEVLRTTQIDQGAQQVRRLGRIALFHHYRAKSNVRSRLEEAIRSLRRPDKMGVIGRTADGRRELRVTDRNQLRVFVVCSICGGTGSGTFLDMAYIARDVAKNTGVDVRSCEVIGVLLMPEAFPEIESTGGARIRANAYAALLDLEYYNQPASTDEPLYNLRLQRETVSVPGAPFSLAYLVGASSEQGPLRGMQDLAPVLGDALFSMVGTGMGARLNGVLDNVRASLIDYDDAGYRAFYSALSIAQIAYPRAQLEEAYTRLLKRRAIEERILQGASARGGAEADADQWLSGARERIINLLRPNPITVERALQSLDDFRAEVGESEQPYEDLQRAFNESLRRFRLAVDDHISGAKPNAAAAVQRQLVAEIREEVDRVLYRGDGGLYAARARLELLERSITEGISAGRARGVNLNRRFDAEGSAVLQARDLPVVGLLRARAVARTAAETLMRTMQSDAVTSALEAGAREVLIDLIDTLDTMRTDVQGAIRFWEERIPREDAAAGERYSLTTEPLLNRDDVRREVDRALGALFEGDGALSFYTGLAEAMQGDARRASPFADNDSIEDGILTADQLRTYDQSRPPSLSRSLNREEQETIADALESYCERRFARSFASNVVERLNALSPTARRGLLDRIQLRAAPLLLYRDARLQHAPPRVIRVLGARDAASATDLWVDNGGIVKDVSFAATDDPGRVVYLVTHHGIPADVLTNFDEYRHHYETLTAANPDDVFHLDPQLEDEPYDPGSAYFINPFDLDLVFARALAAGFLTQQVDREKVFAVTGTLERRLRQEVTREIGALNTAIDNLEGVGSEAARDEARSLRLVRDDLDRRFLKIEAMGGRTPPYQTTPLYMGGRHGVPIYAATLKQARDALLASQRRALANLFVRASLQALSADSIVKQIADIDQALRDRTEVDEMRSAGGGARYRFKSAYGYPLDSEDGKFERLLYDLLKVYRRALERAQNSRRSSRGYYAPEPIQPPDGGG